MMAVGGRGFYHCADHDQRGVICRTLEISPEVQVRAFLGCVCGAGVVERQGSVEVKDLMPCDEI